MKNTIEQINVDFGEIDILVNNTGYTRIERFIELLLKNGINK